MADESPFPELPPPYEFHPLELPVIGHIACDRMTGGATYEVQGETKITFTTDCTRDQRTDVTDVYGCKITAQCCAYSGTAQRCGPPLIVLNVPEPGSTTMLLAGVALLAALPLLRRRR